MGLYKGEDDQIFVAWWIREAKLWCVPDSKKYSSGRAGRAMLYTDDEFSKLYKPHIPPSNIEIPK